MNKLKKQSKDAFKQHRSQYYKLGFTRAIMVFLSLVVVSNLLYTPHDITYLSFILAIILFVMLYIHILTIHTYTTGKTISEGFTENSVFIFHIMSITAIVVVLETLAASIGLIPLYFSGSAYLHHVDDWWILYIVGIIIGFISNRIMHGFLIYALSIGMEDALMEYSVKNAIMKSVKFVWTNKLKVFGLLISFVLYDIIAVITLGFSLTYSYPYKQVSLLSLRKAVSK